MTNKNRLKKLEKAKAAKTEPQKIITMFDTCDNSPATFDGVEMTQAEAEAKAAALPESVLLIRVQYVDMKGGEHGNQ